MRDTELAQKLAEILSRQSGNANDDKEDAVQALLEYVNDDSIREMFERIWDT